MLRLRSRLFAPTHKQDPADAVLASHRLLVRAGFIRQAEASAGTFTFLPLAVRVLEKLEAIVDSEMARAGANKVEMPALLPAELWRRTGRWDSTGDELFRLTDRKSQEFCLGPTHEELVTSLVGTELLSYKQLPVTLYQVTRKYRDERRPRFGLLRGREFLMKDAYSFAASDADSEDIYQAMRAAYDGVLRALDVPFAEVEADTGNIGGSQSHEVHVLSEHGEDTLLTCSRAEECGYAANQEKADMAPLPRGDDAAAVVVVGGADGGALAALRLPAGFEPNLLKASRALGQEATCVLREHDGAGLPALDHWDVPGGLALATHGRGCPCPGCDGHLRESAGIEVGHVFHLGTLYSDKLGATFQGQDGRQHPLIMGCYGLGVTRLMAAVVESLHDDRGIVWPEAIAPFRVAVVTPGAKGGAKADEAQRRGEEVAGLLQHGDCGDVLLDDRWTGQMGFKLSEAELLGHPWVVIPGRDYVSPTEGCVELRNRRDGTVQQVPLAEALSQLKIP